MKKDKAYIIIWSRNEIKEIEGLIDENKNFHAGCIYGTLIYSSWEFFESKDKAALAVLKKLYDDQEEINSKIKAIFDQIK
jgi:hypothetical protein